MMQNDFNLFEAKTGKNDSVDNFSSVLCALE